MLRTLRRHLLRGLRTPSVVRLQAQARARNQAAKAVASKGRDSQ